jgi:hypothetical protein
MRSVHFVSKTAEEYAEECAEQIRKWENDPPASPCLLATSYQNGLNGFQQDHVKAMELYAKAQ